MNDHGFQHNLNSCKKPRLFDSGAPNRSYNIVYTSLLFVLFLAGVIVISAAALHAQDGPSGEPTGVIEKTGEFLPLSASFTNSEGETVTLGELVAKPTLLLPVYYNCPQICSFDMANLALALQRTSIDPETFAVITISFDHKETAADARRSKHNYTAMLKEYFPTDEWHFLVGDEENILAFTSSIGYSFKPAERGLFLHPSALVAVDSTGKIIKYVYGAFLRGDVDLALAEAEKGTPATSIKRFISYCISGEIKNNKTVFLILKSSVILLIAVGGFFLIRLLRKETDT